MLQAKPITREQARQLDQLAEQTLGIPGLVLMENAGINASAAIRELLEGEVGVQPADARVAVICGGANNGGDGYVCARQLHNWGASVTIFAVKAPAKLTGEAATMHDICRRMDLPIDVINKDDTAAGRVHAQHLPQAWEQAHVVIDAILGTGVQGEVRQHEATIIHAMNRLNDPRIVALDIPSGLDCDTGQPANATVKADLTVTFAARKVGFDQPKAQPYTGRVRVGQIGTPPQLLRRVLRGQ